MSDHSLRTVLTGKLTRIRLDAFVARHASDAYTLDIGCAHSPYSKHFKNRVGFDIAPGPGVDVVGDAHAMPFAGETFDLIVATEVLEHLHSPHKAIAEMHRVLKKGGRLLLTTRFIIPIHDAPNDFYRYTEYGLRYLLANWDILELEEEFPPKNTIAVLIQRMGLNKNLRGGKIARVFFLVLARCVYYLPTFSRSTNGHHAITSGYYVFAAKKK
jgi:SAM-dependent methyltransferase